MTREEAATDLKERLAKLDREQLLAFIAAMDEGDTQEILEEATELVDDIFNEEVEAEAPEGDSVVGETHASVLEVIDSILAT